jgi:hypothetical protein
MARKREPIQAKSLFLSSRRRCPSPSPLSPSTGSHGGLSHRQHRRVDQIRCLVLPLLPLVGSTARLRSGTPNSPFSLCARMARIRRSASGGVAGRCWTWWSRREVAVSHGSVDGFSRAQPWPRGSASTLHFSARIRSTSQSRALASAPSRRARSWLTASPPPYAPYPKPAMRMDTRIGAAKYPIKNNRLGYVSQTYPTCIRIRYTPDTRYKGCQTYPRWLDEGYNI